MKKTAFVSGGTRGIGRACAAILKEQGYAVKNAQAADLFPRCAHIESIVCLAKE